MITKFIVQILIIKVVYDNVNLHRKNVKKHIIKFFIDPHFPTVYRVVFHGAFLGSAFLLTDFALFEFGCHKVVFQALALPVGKLLFMSGITEGVIRGGEWAFPVLKF